MVSSCQSHCLQSAQWSHWGTEAQENQTFPSKGFPTGNSVRQQLQKLELHTCRCTRLQSKADLAFNPQMFFGKGCCGSLWPFHLEAKGCFERLCNEWTGSCMSCNGILGNILWVMFKLETLHVYIIHNNIHNIFSRQWLSQCCYGMLGFIKISK